MECQRKDSKTRTRSLLGLMSGIDEKCLFFLLLSRFVSVVYK